MQQGMTRLFDLLLEINRRPEPFSEYTARELWTDPYTSEQMLAYHLNENIDAASRNPAFIDRSVEWIVSHFGLTSESKVVDFGCGPGLYTQRLARAGAKITGLDFSANSLRYARKNAATEDLDIDYVETDYLDFDTDCRFDLIMMIMCDFSVLNPDQRSLLLDKFRTLLTDGGAVLLDVHSVNMFNRREEIATYELNLLNGFWSPDDYYGFLNTFKYDKERVLLDKYTIVERDRTRQIYNWFQCFEPSELKKEFQNSGLDVVETLGDVAGKDYDPEADEFAVVARSVNWK